MQTLATHIESQLSMSPNTSHMFIALCEDTSIKLPIVMLLYILIVVQG